MPGHQQLPRSGGQSDPPHMYGRLFQHTRADHTVLHRQHGGPMVAEEKFGNINVATSPPPKPPRDPPTVPTLFTLPRLYERGIQRHL